MEGGLFHLRHSAGVVLKAFFNMTMPNLVLFLFITFILFIQKLIYSVSQLIYSINSSDKLVNS